MKYLISLVIVFLGLSCSEPKVERSAIDIVVLSKDTVQLDNRSVPLVQLTQELEKLGVTTLTQVTITTAEGVTMEAVQNLQDLLRSQNITKITFKPSSQS